MNPAMKVATVSLTVAITKLTTMENVFVLTASSKKMTGVSLNAVDTKSLSEKNVCAEMDFISTDLESVKSSPKMKNAQNMKLGMNVPPHANKRAALQVQISARKFAFRNVFVKKVIYGRQTDTAYKLMNAKPTVTQNAVLTKY